MKFKNKLPLLLLLCAAVYAGTGAYAQQRQAQTPVPIPVQNVNTVNFTDLANYELQHPVPLVRREVEQGEERFEDFRFTPKAVDPNAATFTIPQSQRQIRASVNSPAPSISFNGTQDNGTLIPPDIRGAIGPSYVMETNNQEFKIYTRAGGLVSTVSITTFFTASGGSGYFDPHVLYDPTSSRFIVCIDGNVSNGHGGLFVAVSQTSDPTGSWYVYSFDAVGTTSDFIDYPLLGYNTNWVVVTANDFTSNTTAVGKIYVMSKASLLSGTLGTVNTFTDANAFTLAPAQTYDNTQTTEYLVQDYNGSSGGSGYMQICTVTGTAAAPVYTSGSQIGVTSPWSETQVQATQSGSTHTFDNGDTRVGNALYINGSLWFCHTVFLPATTPTHSGVDWWQVNPTTNTVQQFQRLENTSGPTFYFYPSINVNAAGDFLLGFCTSSPSTYASSAYVFHAATDAANTTQNIYTYKTGLASYFKDFGSGRNRWGDYTGTAVDPSDNSFWNFSEFAGTGNNWGTVIARVPASSGTTATCNAPTGMATSAIASTTATFSWTAATGATSYNIQYRKVGTTTWSTGTSATTSYNASGLTASTNYEWQVQTICASGSSSFTASTTFTTTAVTTCAVPTGLASGSITTTGATVSWAAVAGATSYTLGYKLSTASTYTTVTGITTTSHAFTGLTCGSTYQYKVLSVCSSGSSAYSAVASFATSSCSTVTYCTSVGNSTAYEYINNVTLGSINNTSGNNNGYGNYINLNTNLTGGTANTIKLTPGFTGSSYTENWTVWIDYNHNGVFTDAGEKVTTGSSSSTLSKTFTVPTTALNGATRMRVQMAYSGIQTNSCATIAEGEVEDYTVTIVGNAHSPVYGNGDVAGSTLETVSNLVLYPNPTQNMLTVQFDNNLQATMKINIYNMAGQRVISYETNATEGFNSYNVETEKLTNGIYIFELENNGTAQRRKITIAK